MIPFKIDINPMVTMMTEMIGSPINRRKNTRSTLMARKNMMMVERTKASRMGTPAQMAKA